MAEQANREPSISEILASMGYGHRRVRDGFYKHEIFHIETGVVVGQHGAGYAIEAAQAHSAERANG